MVDSCDRARLTESSEELKEILKEDQLRNVPVLILANKQDLPGAANCTEITQAFEMQKNSRQRLVCSGDLRIHW